MGRRCGGGAARWVLGCRGPGHARAAPRLLKIHAVAAHRTRSESASGLPAAALQTYKSLQTIHRSSTKKQKEAENCKTTPMQEHLTRMNICCPSTVQ